MCDGSANKRQINSGHVPMKRKKRREPPTKLAPDWKCVGLRKRKMKAKPKCTNTSLCIQATLPHTPIATATTERQGRDHASTDSPFFFATEDAIFGLPLLADGIDGQGIQFIKLKIEGTTESSSSVGSIRALRE